MSSRHCQVMDAFSSRFIHETEAIGAASAWASYGSWALISAREAHVHSCALLCVRTQARICCQQLPQRSNSRLPLSASGEYGRSPLAIIFGHRYDAIRHRCRKGKIKCKFRREKFIRYLLQVVAEKHPEIKTGKTLAHYEIQRFRSSGGECKTEALYRHG
jgi:hypothetical protein